MPNINFVAFLYLDKHVLVNISAQIDQSKGFWLHKHAFIGGPFYVEIALCSQIL